MKIFKSLVAMAITAGCVSSVQAAVIQVAVDPSQVSLVSETRRITIPLPDFSFDGSEDTVRVLFSSPLQLSYVGPGSGFTIAELTADSDGTGDALSHQPGVSLLLNSGLTAIPEFTSSGSHTDLVGSTQLLINPDISTLFSADGEQFTVYGLSYQAPESFDAANLTNGQMKLDIFNFDGGDNTPGVITVVPEPTSLALLGIGGLIVARRRR
ncbi:MAG: PEP-CTERM sorting domain-containing protein [Planctomycetota bacterium]